MASDIFKETLARMRDNQDKSTNTREAVGVSILIVADLRQRRTRDYKWAGDRGYPGEAPVHSRQAHLPPEQVSGV